MYILFFNITVIPELDLLTRIFIIFFNKKNLTAQTGHMSNDMYLVLLMRQKYYYIKNDFKFLKAANNT